MDSVFDTPPSPTVREVSGNLSGFTLDPEDPFESAIIDIVTTNRSKRADYAVDGDPYSNFYHTAALMGMDGFGPLESVLFNIFQKLARLNSLRSNGRMEDAQNETVGDTYLDIAVYSVILYSLYNTISGNKH